MVRFTPGGNLPQDWETWFEWTFFKKQFLYGFSHIFWCCKIGSLVAPWVGRFTPWGSFTPRLGNTALRDGSYPFSTFLFFVFELSCLVKVDHFHFLCFFVFFFRALSTTSGTPLTLQVFIRNPSCVLYRRHAVHTWEDFLCESTSTS